MVWIVIQIILGIGSVWFDGRLFGGNPRAKLVWKYHRYAVIHVVSLTESFIGRHCRFSGYLLFPLLLLTACLGGLWSHFVTRNTLLPVRIILFGVAPLCTFIAVFARIR